MQATESTLASPASGGLAGLPGALVELMKPRIIMLLLVTTLATMTVAGSAVPPLPLILFTLLGGILTSGSANAVNMVYDRDIDAIMSRTRFRPLPSGRLTPAVALTFAVILGVAGVAELWYFVNPLAALLALSGNLFYVFVYTMLLKRHTAQNIVIGGAAGAVPPLVGWAAVRGDLDWAALILFLIIFLWTPPHFWALALYKNEDYRAAKVPMMPVVHGKVHTMRQMLAYCAVLIPVSVLLMAVHPMTVFYFAAALALGVTFAFFGLRVARERTDVAARRMFGVSILYLGAIFGSMVLDQLVAAKYLPPAIAQTIAIEEPAR
jgi:protoheme IX farnesyltransferase